MKIIYDDKYTLIGVFFESKAEGKTFVEVTAAALAGKPLNKRSSAYKLAKKIDDELPVF